MADLSNIIVLTRTQYNNLVAGASITISGVTYSYDDNAIYEIMTLSYMLATEEYIDDSFIKFKYIKNATKEHDLILLIEALGKAILKHNKKSKYPIMFRSFVLARPNVHTEHYIESRENKAVQMGLLALYYTKFVINYDITNNFIDEMLRKGI